MPAAPALASLAPASGLPQGRAITVIASLLPLLFVVYFVIGELVTGLS